MQKSVEAVIARAVADEIGRNLQAIEKKIDKLQSVISSLSIPKAEELQGEKLLTITEAKKRLLVSTYVLDQMIEAGDLSMVQTPNGRRKILESSINSYLKRKI